MPTTTSPAPQPTHFSAPQLAQRGWSKSMITKFLGEPDATSPNPYYRSAAPRKLYASNRVLACEVQSDFLLAKDKAALRSQQGVLRADQAAAALEAKVLQSVRLKAMTLAALEAAAIRHKVQRDEYVASHRGQLPSGENPSRAPREHIHRWMVNYARHELSNYDTIRDRYVGQVGVHRAAEAVRSAVLHKIAEQWPELEAAVALAARAEYE